MAEYETLDDVADYHALQLSYNEPYGDDVRVHTLKIEEIH
jgi:hypothetical protein